MGISKLLASKNLYSFAAGALAAIAVPLIVKSKAVRCAAVCVTAKGMKLRDDALAAVESINEDAKDIYEEAKQKNSAALGEAE
jgi:hypothetical protein